MKIFALDVVLALKLAAGFSLILAAAAFAFIKISDLDADAEINWSRLERKPGDRPLWWA